MAPVPDARRVLRLLVHPRLLCVSRDDGCTARGDGCVLRHCVRLRSRADVDRAQTSSSATSLDGRSSPLQRRKASTPRSAARIRFRPSVTAVRTRTPTTSSRRTRGTTSGRSAARACLGEGAKASRLSGGGGAAVRAGAAGEEAGRRPRGSGITRRCGRRRTTRGPRMRRREMWDACRVRSSGTTGGDDRATKSCLSWATTRTSSWRS